MDENNENISVKSINAKKNVYGNTKDRYNFCTDYLHFGQKKGDYYCSSKSIKATPTFAISTTPVKDTR